MPNMDQFVEVGAFFGSEVRVSGKSRWAAPAEKRARHYGSDIYPVVSVGTPDPLRPLENGREGIATGIT